MDSRSAQNMLRMQDGIYMPRLWDVKIKREKEGMPEGGNISYFDKKEIQDGTDYKSPHSLEKLSLKERERYSRTNWPPANHPNPASVPKESRIVGHTVWRRYPDGNLDIRTSFQMVVEALRKYQESPTLNEIDALILSSAIPSFRFDGLPKEVVDIKAFLSGPERRQLQDMLRERASEAAVRILVETGGV